MMSIGSRKRRASEQAEPEVATPPPKRVASRPRREIIVMDVELKAQVAALTQKLEEARAEIEALKNAPPPPPPLPPKSYKPCDCKKKTQPPQELAPAPPAQPKYKTKAANAPGHGTSIQKQFFEKWEKMNKPGGE